MNGVPVWITADQVVALGVVVAAVLLLVLGAVPAKSDVDDERRVGR